jgi:O-antigen ligase
LSAGNDISQTWVDKKDTFVLIFVFFLLPFVAQAGGLGIAAIVALGGGLTLIGFGPAKLISLVKNTPKPFWALMALLVYGLMSSLWSPYQSTRPIPNPMILILGVPLYFLLARIVIRQSGSKLTWLRRIWLWGTVASVIAFFIDLTTGYSISLAVDPVSSGQSFESRRGELIQNLGHGVAVLTLLYPAIAVTLWQRGLVGKMLSGAVAILILLCGYFVGMSASVFALLLALIFMGLAALKPKFAVAAVHAFAALSLLGAPIIAFLASKLTSSQMAGLPFSWEERIHNWRYIFGKIREHPIMGHGFDAVRTFSDKHSIRGFDDRAIVSLHPHNAGLQIWVELGLVGIAILLTALYLSHKLVARTRVVRTPYAIALCGIAAAAIVNASLTFGVWQDWWWAAIILSISAVALIPYTTKNI